MKARIIYKPGKEGINSLDAIRGIAVKMFNGQDVLVYPKYAELPLLHKEDYSRWKEKSLSEVEALMDDRDPRELTVALVEAGSPAAKFVDELGGFSLPSLQMLAAIVVNRDDIDELAKEIEGADLLDSHTSLYWSCFRYSGYFAWLAYGSYGFFYSYYMCVSYLAVPVSLYDLRKQA